MSVWLEIYALLVGLVVLAANMLRTLMVIRFPMPGENPPFYVICFWVQIFAVGIIPVMIWERLS